MLMAKKWLTLVKNAFRSSTSSKNREQEEDDKKREKRKWLFRKQSTNSRPQQFEAVEKHPVDEPVEAPIVRRKRRPSSIINEHYVAVVIQTAFRGYIARRALRALKGIVKLQALIRGHNVRRQANLTLKCIEALVRVQDKVRDQRARLSLSYEAASRKSMAIETNGLWESKYLQEIADRKSTSRDSCSGFDDSSRKEAVLKREKALAYAFSNKIWRSQRNQSSGDENELEDRARWLDRWMATKQYESRTSTDTRDQIKTLEVDMTKPYTYSTPNPKKFQQNGYLHRTPSSPSPCKHKPIQVRSASPRCMREERSYSVAHTPSLASSRNWLSGKTGSSAGIGSTIPNYMAITESAKARVRPQSAPRQRPSTPDRERGCGGGGGGGGSSVKKRLSYPAPEPIDIEYGSFSHNLRSPSFKSVQCCHLGIDQQYCYGDSFGGQISPCSTTDLRWLK